MGTHYGDAKATSANSSRYLKTFIIDDVTVNNNTTYTVSIKAGVTSNYTGSATISGCHLSYSLSGTQGSGGTGNKSDSSWKYTNKSPYTKYGGGNNKNFVNTTYTWTKGTAAASMTITMKGYGNGGNNWGSSSKQSTATCTISIPARPKFTVTYNANNGTGSGSTSQFYGYNITLSNGSGFSRTGYTISGWNTKSDKTGTHYSLSQTYTVTANVTLYAEWTAKTTTVTFNPNGGKLNNSGNWGTDAGTTHNHALTCTYDSSAYWSSGGATRPGFIFSGWSLTADGTGTLIWDSAGSCIGVSGYWTASGSSGKWSNTSSTLTVYAKWTGVRMFVKVADTWKESGIMLNSNGTWKYPHAGYVKVNGVWKTIIK